MNLKLSLFEELCQEILLGHNPDYHIRFIAEYSEMTKEINVNVTYNGDLFDPSTTDNELSLAILQSRIQSMTYIKQDGEMRNSIQIRL